MVSSEKPIVVHAYPSPRLMGAAMAASYLGISDRAFEMRWRREQLPEPIRIGRRLLWDRAMLDKWVDEISGLVPPTNFFGD